MPWNYSNTVENDGENSKAQLMFFENVVVEKK